MILSFTPGDLMAAVTVEKGWHPTIFKEIKSGASKSGKSINHFVELEITDGKFKGKNLKIAFNSETSSAQLLGDLMMFPEHDLLRVMAAQKNIPLDQVQLEGFDTESLLNVGLDVQYGIETVNGLLINNVTGFAPLGKGSQVAF